MIKDCVSCIHQRVCQHKELNPKFKEEMRGLIKKWGDIYSEDCPEWHQNPHYHDIGCITGNNDDKPKTDCRTWNDSVDKTIKPTCKVTNSIKDEITANKESKDEYDFVKELEKALGFQIRMDGIRGL